LVFSTLLGLSLAQVHGSVNTPDGVLQYDEDWGYVDIRANAHTFWWLYAVKPANNRPLFLWLQGGPGADSTGFGNFEETGPKTITEQDNMYTWLAVADMVYVDNPVGAGFSYVDQAAAYTANVSIIGQDLLAWARVFFTKHSEYRTRPFYIFCESYGGKMAAEFANVLRQEIAAGTLSMNFRGVGLGDSWISPIDYVNSWGPYLSTMSFLDTNQLTQVNNQAATCQNLVNQGSWTQATNCWGDMEDLVGRLTDGVSWYNILKRGGTDDWSQKKVKAETPRDPIQLLFDNHVKPLQFDALTDYMNGPVRQKLGIIPASVRFGAQSGQVFQRQNGDFMKPNWDTVDTLLQNNVNVFVYNGQTDLICDTPGTEMWLKRLTWSGLNSYQASAKRSYYAETGANRQQTSGFYKKYQNLQFWYILRAGHMVAYDAPQATVYMLKDIVQSTAAGK